MPVLPIPMIISLILIAFLVQRLLRREMHGTLLALIAICAVQAAVMALARYYGFDALRPLQPFLATVIPPVAWFAFVRAAGGELTLAKMGRHVIGPLLALLFLAVQPALLDVLIPLSFTIYGVAMLVRLRAGEDSLLHSRLDNGAPALIAWRILAMALIASAACDVLIAYGMAMGRSDFLMWIPSLVSSLSLLSLGVVSLSGASESHRETETGERERDDDALVRDRAIMDRLDAYVAATKPYLDPDLTLARLARKLVIPAKQLSAAINRVKGVNVSKYINALRIEEACRLLAEGKPITTAMLESGFNTKSNFNREFSRVKGKSPSAWLSEERA